MEHTLHESGSAQAPAERQHERRTEQKVIAFQDRRVNEWRRAADRAEKRGDFVTATMFRNEAYFIEQGER